ncbi:hypothetical protein QUB08_11730 [Microcoleus sp. BR0-C5]|uniref:hypothetical protein n=1 Tax=Microcoleus sp. BR0-C5 TaxID=2818713 RepID=UPI002FD4388B
MSFEFEGVNQFSAEVEQDSAVQQQQPPANSVAEELNDTELDAIAGGHMLWDYMEQWRLDTDNPDDTKNTPPLMAGF